MRRSRPFTFSEGKENSWKSFQGRLLGDVSGAAVSRCNVWGTVELRGSPRIHARLRERACKVGARLRRFNFSNELLPWRRLQWGGGGVMATDYLLRQTPREVLLCRCVTVLSDLHHLFQGYRVLLWFLHPPSAFVTTLIIRVHLAPSDVWKLKAQRLQH